MDLGAGEREIWLSCFLRMGDEVGSTQRKRSLGSRSQEGKRVWSGWECLDMGERAERRTRESRAWTGCSPLEEGPQQGAQRERPRCHQAGLKRSSLNWHEEQLRAPFKEEYVNRDFRPGVGAGSRSHCLQLLFLVLSYGFLTK